MTATLPGAARDLLAALQAQPAMSEGSLKAWGRQRRPQIPFSRVEGIAMGLVDAGLATVEVKPDGLSVYRAATPAPRAEPAPVEVTTSLTTLHAWGQELFEWLRWLPEASTADLHAWGAAHVPPLTPDQVEEIANELVKAKKATVEVKPGGKRGTGLVVYRAAPVKLTAPPAPCVECAALTRDLIAARVRIEQLSAQITQATLSPNAKDALAVLSTTRGTSPGEIATRSRILRRAVPHALAELRAAGVAVETTPGLWRRR